MLRILKNNREYEIEFNGIKIFNCSNTTNVYKNIFVDSHITIDDKEFNKDNIIYINELTKLDDFINLSKKSFVLNLIFKLLEENNIIQRENINKIVEKINDELEIELLSESEGDISKIIQQLFEINEIGYLNIELLDLLFEKCFSNKKYLFVLDNVSWIKIDKLLKYINNHNFIILTNDFRDLIYQKNHLEIITLIKKEYNYQDLINWELIINMIEKELSIIIDDDIFKKFILEKDSLLSLRMLSIVKNI